MTDLLYSRHTLRDIPHRFREFTAITDGRDPEEYIRNIRTFAHSPVDCWIAEREGHLVGTFAFYTQPKLPASVRDDNNLTGLGVNLETLHIRSLIYVHPDFRGQGIARELEARVDEDSAALGFQYHIVFHTDTDAIWEWLHRRSDATHFHLEDGRSASLIPTQPVRRHRNGNT